MHHRRSNNTLGNQTVEYRNSFHPKHTIYPCVIDFLLTRASLSWVLFKKRGSLLCLMFIKRPYLGRQWLRWLIGSANDRRVSSSSCPWGRHFTLPVSSMAPHVPVMVRGAVDLYWYSLRTAVATSVANHHKV